MSMNIGFSNTVEVDMKVKRKYGFENGTKKGVAKREIEIEEGERLSVRVLDRRREPPEEKEIIAFFMPGVLTLQWERDTKIEQ